MNPNQYYGSQSNYNMPMQNAQSYYQPPMMSPRPPDPTPAPPQVNHVQFSQSQPMMNQHIPPPQYNQPQYQFGNNQSINYPTATPPVQSTQYQPAPPNVEPNPVAARSPVHQNYQFSQPNPVVARPPVQQNYQYNQPNPGQFYPNNVPNPNVSNPNQYGGTVNTPENYNPGVPSQNNYSVPQNNQGGFYNPPPTDNQQISQQFNSVDTKSAHVEEPQSTSNKDPPAQFKEPTLEKVRTFRPTNVVGDYKCSDFPNLFTGPFRYSATVQRKPFTMKGDSGRPSTQPNPEGRTNVGLTRHAKRWELRGGKYYGCFTSRTNGLQDNCPKARCKLCPTEKKK